MTCEVVVMPERAGERIDVFLTGEEGIQTRSIAQKLLAGDFVYSKGRTLAKNYKVSTGETICYTLPEPTASDVAAEDIPLDIVYEDEHLLVVNKPSGLVVHPGAGNWSGTLVNALLHHCRGNLSGIGGVLRPGIVHRLDKDTSGLMVVAKNDTAHQGLAAQLADNSMLREYNALCFGVLQQDKVKIDVPIGRHPVDRKKMMVFTTPTTTKVRRAVTYVDVLRRGDRFSLVSARLETGRTHQIRVHLAHIGHPVLGDDVYCGRGQPEFAKNGQLLHATRISFIHPISGDEVGFTATWPEYFNVAVDEVNW